MSLSDILAAIRRDTAEAVAGLEAEAAARRAVVLAQAEQEAARVEAEMSGSRDDALREQALRLERAARLDAQQELAAAREELYQRIVAGVGRRLAGLRQSDADAHARCTELLLQEALAVAGSATEVEVAPADQAQVAALLAGTGVAVRASLRSWGGVVVHGADGRRVDNTHESRLLRADPELRVLASGWLRADEGPTGS